MSRFSSQGKAFERLVDFCEWNSLSFTFTRWESEDNASIEIFSPAESECFGQKRVYDINDFIDRVKNEKPFLKEKPKGEGSK